MSERGRKMAENAKAKSCARTRIKRHGWVEPTTRRTLVGKKWCAVSERRTGTELSATARLVVSHEISVANYHTELAALEALERAIIAYEEEK